MRRSNWTTPAPGFREDVSYEVNDAGCVRARRGTAAKGKARRRGGVVTPAQRERSRFCARRWLKVLIGLFILRTTGRYPGCAKTSRGLWPLRSRGEEFDLIVTACSRTIGHAQTGVLLAEVLGWPHATIIIGIEKTDAGAAAQRELEAGRYQHVDVPLPAVLTIKAALTAALCHAIGIKQARTSLAQGCVADVEGK